MTAEESPGGGPPRPGAPSAYSSAADTVAQAPLIAPPDEKKLCGFKRVEAAARRIGLDLWTAHLGKPLDRDARPEWFLESPFGGEPFLLVMRKDSQLEPLDPALLRALGMTAEDLIEPPPELPPWEQLAFDMEVDAQARRLRVSEAAKARLAAEQRGPVVMPPVVPLRDFLEVPDEATRYRIADVMAVGAHAALFGPHKVAKSTAIANLIRSLVDGEPFLGCYLVAPVEHVTLIDDELDDRMLRRWLREQGIQNVDRVSVVSLRGRLSTFDILNGDIRARWADALRGTQLVVFDCLRPALDALGLDENHDAGRFLVSFDELLGEAGIPECVVVHHMGHANERARGDSRLQDWPDVIWKLVRESDDPASPRYFSAFGRDVDVRETRLNYDPETRRLTLGTGSRKDAKVGAALESVLALLRTEHDQLSGRQIEDRLAEVHPRGEIRNALKAIREQRLAVFVNGPRNAHLYSLEHDEESA